MPLFRKKPVVIEARQYTRNGLEAEQVAEWSGGQQTDDGLVEAQQGFEQVGADEARHTGDKPGFGAGLEVLLDLLVAGCHGGSVVCSFKQASSYEL